MVDSGVMKKFFLVFLIFPFALFAQVDFSHFDSYQNQLTQKEIQERLDSFAGRGNDARRYLSITEEALILYNAPAGKVERKIEYELTLAPKAKKQKKVSPRKSLIGAKVAIDPGHFGGDYAHLEERYIDIPPSLEREDTIQFDEGTLSFLTAAYLKILLEKEGAIVMLTRDQVGKGAYREGFFDWLKKHPYLWSGEVALNKLFRRHYNRLDLRARCEKINAFGPDLSVMIHYNSHAGRDEVSSNHDVVSNNFNLVFVGGAFCSNELIDPESRYEFFRLLVSDDFSRSVKLSRSILDKFVSKLKVPVVSAADGSRYLESVCHEVEPGVYARNLALTRLVHGPICYGESLVQNNIDECLNLARKDFVINGLHCSSRIKEVAEAYFEGIKEYLLD